MARDPAGTYSYPPGIEGHPDATIESGDYNSFLFDVQQDLNLPRPIVAGGTGATTAQGALANLGGELAAQAVTNYNTFPFVAGSFYSVAGATGEPVTSHNFIGICYVGVDASSMVLEARDESDTVVPGRVWVREKKAGSWSAWVSTPAPADLDATYINAAGDTMTGTLSATGFGSRTGLSGAATGNFFNFAWTGSVLNAWIDSTNLGALATQAYADNAVSNRVLRAGDTITGNLTVNGGLFTPTVTAGAASTEVVTAAWVRNYGQARDPQLFAGIPINNSANYTTVATDAQKCIAGSGTITINSALYAAGTVLTFAGYGGVMTITCAGNTIYWISPSGLVSGNRTLPDRGIATAIRTPDGNWIIGGNGLT
jgi:hypothetical protein